MHVWCNFLPQLGLQSIAPFAGAPDASVGRGEEEIGGGSAEGRGEGEAGSGRQDGGNAEGLMGVVMMSLI